MFVSAILLMLMALCIGARYGGAFFGMIGALGLGALMLIFKTPPANPPINVMLIITSVVLAASTLQASGGMDVLIKKAEKLLRKHPNQVVFISPLIAYIFTFMAGTGNVLYNILPVVAEVARKAGIRPERPISISVIASQHAVPASPISAATVAMVALLSPFDITITQILALVIPASFIGIMAGAVSVCKYGKDLTKDDEYLKKLANGEITDIDRSKENALADSKYAKMSVAIFLISAVLVVLLGTFSSLRPEVINAAGKVSRVGMTQMIEIVMMSSAALMVLLCKTDVSKVPNTPVFKAGMVGVVSVFGLAWMTDSFVAQNIVMIKSMTKDIVTANPSYFGIALFIVSVFTNSQGATVAALMPLGVTLGIDPILLAALYPAVCGYYVIPSNGVMLAGVAFDNTGTTKIGKYVVNHSYMLPGTVATVVSVVVSVILSKIFF